MAVSKQRRTCLKGAHVAVKTVAEHPAVAAWLKAGERIGLRSARPERVTVLKGRGHSIVYRLEGAGPRGSAVIAKHCSREAARIESAVYRDILPRLGVLALEFHGCIREDGERYWLFIEDAGEDKYSYRSEQHRALAGQWLGRVHAAASRLGAPACLPERGPAWYLRELRLLVDG